MVVVSKCFVNRSAGLFLPSTLLNCNLLSAAVCWIHSRPVSMCRVLPSPRLLMIPQAALASPQISPVACHPKSFRRLSIPKVSAAAFSVAYSSLSPELRATSDWVLLHPFRVCLPRVMQPPMVDFLVSLQPAQSASLYVRRILGTCCHSKHCCILGLPFRYLPRRFSCAQFPFVGVDMCLANSLTA